ncbi:UNVERIFIED_CONTAM: hypothetical protein HDU68_012420 [Siphonaria sp. JEL0065]|nr:hypothetical protein HDU68_012420 [Siphonaria sp. JEL0065]
MDSDSDQDNLPFAGCAEDFGSSTFNLYYSSPTTLAAISSLLLSTRSLTNPSSNTTAVNFLDLGCGDGRLVIHIAKTLGIKSTGIDFSPASVQEARENAEKEGVSDLCTFTLADFTQWEDISLEYTWVAAYLPNYVLHRLKGVVERWLVQPSKLEPHLFLSVLYKMKGWEQGVLAGKNEALTLWVADKATIE